MSMMNNVHCNATFRGVGLKPLNERQTRRGNPRCFFFFEVLFMVAVLEMPEYSVKMFCFLKQNIVTSADL